MHRAGNNGMITAALPEARDEYIELVRPQPTQDRKTLGSMIYYKNQDHGVLPYHQYQLCGAQSTDSGV